MTIAQMAWAAVVVVALTFVSATTTTTANAATAAAASPSPTASAHAYRESMHAVPLADGHIHAAFAFDFSLDARVSDTQHLRHYGIFPRAVGKLLATHSAQELHVRLTQGRWRSDSWGLPRVTYSSSTPAPPGAEVLAWFAAASAAKGQKEDEVDVHWTKLTEALGGLLGASLGPVADALHSVSPTTGYEPVGAVALNITRRDALRVGWLERETVCAENLAAWKRLLPCGDRAGLASLLKAQALYAGQYHSLGMHAWHECASTHSDGGGDVPAGAGRVRVRTGGVRGSRSNSSSEGTVCSRLQLRLRLTVESVLAASDGVWSFGTNLGSSLATICPAAKRTMAHVHTGRNSTLPMTISPPNYHLQVDPATGQRTLATFRAEAKPAARVDIVNRDSATRSGNSSYNFRLPLDLQVRMHRAEWRAAPGAVALAPASDVFTDRFITGHGSYSGGITTVIGNRRDTPLQGTLLQVIPWVLRTYTHTLRLTMRTLGPDGSTAILNAHGTTTTFGIKDQRLRPAIDRGRPLVWELDMYLPPHSVARVAFAFEHAFLTVTEHPVDPQRGWPVPEAIFTSRYSGVRYYVPGLAVQLPTPDFSMLYNATMLAATVFSLVTTTFLALSLKSLQRPPPTGTSQSLMQRIKQKLTSRFGRKQQDAATENLVEQVASGNNVASSSSSSRDCNYGDGGDKKTN